MIYDIQRAPLTKRIASGLLDLIFLIIIGTGIAYLSAVCLNVDSNLNKLREYYSEYEEKYDVKFNLSQEEFDKLTPAEKAHYEEVDKILKKDKDLSREYGLFINKSLIIIVLGVLVSTIICEFVVPLIFKNGQTIGKKVFSLIIVRNNSVKVSNVQLFVRALLGKGVIELMIPIYIIYFMFTNLIGIVGPIVVIGLLILQIVLVFATKNRTLIHDVMAYTVVADKDTQMIFENEEKLIEYKEKIHLESVEKNNKGV